LLRRVGIRAALYNLCTAMALAVFLVYAVRDLRVSAAAIGLLFSIGGGALVLGSSLLARWGARMRVGTAMSVGAAVQGSGFLLVPLAPRAHPMPFFAAAIAIESLFSPLWNITQISLRQTVTPRRLQGRMTATMRFMIWGALPIGSLLGGVLGPAVGRRETLWIAAVGSALSSLFVVIGPLARLHDFPAAPDDDLPNPENALSS